MRLRLLGQDVHVVVLLRHVAQLVSQIWQSFTLCELVYGMVRPNGQVSTHVLSNRDSDFVEGQLVQNEAEVWQVKQFELHTWQTFDASGKVPAGQEL